MVGPAGDVDRFGLPTGPLRQQLFARVLMDLDARLEAEGWGSPSQVFSISTDVTPEEGLAAEDFVTGLTVQQVGRLLDSPVEDLWGQHAPDSVTALVVSVEGTAVPISTDDNTEHQVRLLFLVSRAGDTAEVRHIRGEKASFHPDGEGLATALPQVMARMLGVPDSPAGFRPVHLLSAWIVSQVVAVLSSAYAEMSTSGVDWNVDTFVMASTDDTPMLTDADWETFARAATAAVIIRVISNYLDDRGIGVSGRARKLLDSLSHPHTLRRDVARTDVSEAAHHLGPAAQQLTSLSWQQMSESPFAGLLPALLRSQESTGWAGEELSGWWVFHHAAQTPSQVLAQLRVLSPIAEATCSHVLNLFGFNPPTETWFAPDLT